jgi:membrane protease YdiL (CAAX protease family)
MQEEASRPAAPTLAPAAVAYVTALIGVPAATLALVFAVAAARARGDAARVAPEALGFATSPSGVMAAAATSALVLLLVSGTTARVARRPLRLGPSTASARGLVASTLGMVGLSLATGSAIELSRLGSRGVMGQIAAALGQLGPSGLAAATAAIAIVPAIAEETFFRGLVQGVLVARVGRWRGIFASSVAFGVIHADPVQGPAAALAGIYLGWVAERFGGARPTIVAHTINNALFIVLARVTPLAPLARPKSEISNAAMLGLGLLLLAGSIAFLRGSRAGRPGAPGCPTETERTDPSGVSTLHGTG